MFSINAAFVEELVPRGTVSATGSWEDDILLLLLSAWFVCGCVVVTMSCVELFGVFDIFFYAFPVRFG